LNRTSDEFFEKKYCSKIVLKAEKKYFKNNFEEQLLCVSLDSFSRAAKNA